VSLKAQRDAWAIVSGPSLHSVTGSERPVRLRAKSDTVAVHLRIYVSYVGFIEDTT
jgi:hypothetical protein